MSATLAITHSKRQAGICRLAARPRLAAGAGDACVSARRLVGRGCNGSRMAAGVTLRDRGGEFHQVGSEARRYMHISITSFSAGVSFGASPG